MSSSVLGVTLGNPAELLDSASSFTVGDDELTGGMESAP
jgi:hypothetical protein